MKAQNYLMLSGSSTLKSSLEKNFALAVFLASFVFGLITTFSITAMEWARGDAVDGRWALQLSFYYLIPALIWTALTPLVIILGNRWPVLQNNEWRINLVRHSLLALGVAPLIRFLAIALDFLLKGWLGLIDVPAYEVIYEVRYIILASAPKALITYFLILIIYNFWKHYLLSWHPPEEKGTEGMIKAKYGTQTFFLKTSDILCVEADGNYVNLHTQSRQYRQRTTLSGIYDQLGSQQFFRIHRSVIINREAIVNLQHWRRGEYLIELKNQKRVTSSRGYRKELLTLLDTVAI